MDPQRDAEQYLAFAREHRLQITHVCLTHLHADFLAGHLELRDRAGATICLGARAAVEYPFRRLHDGDSIELGRVRLMALETPGHTPESVSLLVFDPDKSETVPSAVLTGDTLFVGDVGRPDLSGVVGWSAASLAGALYDSLHMKLLPLPDETIVYPAHGAGSLCGRALGKETFSTIGEQRRVNYALQPMMREAFVGLVTVDQPDAPAYFAYDAALNAKERPTLEESLAAGLQPLSVEAVLDLMRAGDQVLDTREPGEFAAAHLTGSINVGLDGQFATWAGSVLRGTAPIVVIAEAGRERESAMRLGRIGFDRVAGYLTDGLRAIEARPDLLSSTTRLSPGVAAQRLSSPAPPLVLDVRSAREHDAKRIPGAISVPLNHLSERAPALPSDRAILVHCAGGYRSSIAASILQRLGFTNVTELAGGIAAWQASGLQTEPL